MAGRWQTKRKNSFWPTSKIHRAHASLRRLNPNGIIVLAADNKRTQEEIVSIFSKKPACDLHGKARGLCRVDNFYPNEMT